MPRCRQRSRCTRAQHGWCAIDSQVYNKEQAEKAWARKIELFKKALA